MKEDNYIKVGKTKKAHGTEGGIRLAVRERYEDAVLNAEVIFLSISGRQVPFFVEKVLHEAPLVLKLEEVDDRDAAYAIASQEVYLRKQDIPEQALPQTPDFMLLEGYQILVEGVGEIGAISRVAEYPQQIMAIIEKEGRELLIPLNEAFILGIDPERQCILMELPEGLLELF